VTDFTGLDKFSQTNWRKSYLAV